MKSELVIISLSQPAANTDLNFTISLRDGVGRVPFDPVSWRLKGFTYTFVNSDITACETVLRIGTFSNTGVFLIPGRIVNAASTVSISHLPGIAPADPIASGSSGPASLPDWIWMEQRNFRLTTTAGVFQFSAATVLVEFHGNARPNP